MQKPSVQVGKSDIEPLLIMRFKGASQVQEKTGNEANASNYIEKTLIQTLPKVGEIVGLRVNFYEGSK